MQASFQPFFHPESIISIILADFKAQTYFKFESRLPNIVSYPLCSNKVINLFSCFIRFTSTKDHDTFISLINSDETRIELPSLMRCF